MHYFDFYFYLFEFFSFKYKRNQVKYQTNGSRLKWASFGSFKRPKFVQGTSQMTRFMQKTKMARDHEVWKLFKT